MPRDRKVEKNFPREFSFPPSNILFFLGQFFSAGVGKPTFLYIGIGKVQEAFFQPSGFMPS
jgi:hypothetical protein